MRARLLATVVFLGIGVVAFACGGKKPPPKEPTITETVADAGADDADAAPPAPKSLYERLGGKDGVGKVVDGFMANLTKNEATKKRFAKLPKDRADKLRQNLIDQICEAAGGDCKYGGKDMKAAHKGMKITDAEWQATVSALKQSLDDNKVPEAEQNDLIAILAPMHDDIVEVKEKPKPPKPAKK